MYTDLLPPKVITWCVITFVFLKLKSTNYTQGFNQLVIVSHWWWTRHNECFWCSVNHLSVGMLILLKTTKESILWYFIAITGVKTSVRFIFITGSERPETSTLTNKKDELDACFYWNIRSLIFVSLKALIYKQYLKHDSNCFLNCLHGCFPPHLLISLAYVFCSWTNLYSISESINSTDISLSS